VTNALDGLHCDHVRDGTPRLKQMNGILRLVNQAYEFKLDGKKIRVRMFESFVNRVDLKGTAHMVPAEAQKLWDSLISEGATIQPA